MRYNLVIFDLDGTILDTLSDLRTALNKVLVQHGYSAHSLENIRRFVGNGAAKLIARAVPENTSSEIQKSLLAQFQSEYAAGMDLESLPYPGIPELLDSLKAHGVHLACNSNKFDKAVSFLCSKYFPDRFEMTSGDRPDMPRKPDPQAVFSIMEAMGISKHRTLFVGDSDVDIKTAQNAGIQAAWVSWGFRHRGEICVPAEIPVFDDAASLLSYIINS